MKPLCPSFLKEISLGQKISIGIALLLAISAFVIVRDLVVCWTMTALPGIPPTRCGLDSMVKEPRIPEDPRSTPVVPDEAVTDVPAPEKELPVWDGSSRVTLLFIGLDARDWEVGAGAPRSDTMILFTIDPVSKTAGMLSIPRDLWINIPGLGYSKINTAYAYGEARKMPGGGPGLAMKTVEHFIGVPIQYYAQVDFNAFEEAIDAMGGLYLCPEERIRIDPIGPKPPVKIGPECRKYWGYEVLGYARNRYTSGGDIDRANRQQKVVMALMDEVFSPENYPDMVARARDIYREARPGVRTNLGFQDAIKLGVLLSQIPPEKVKHGVIDYSMAALNSVIAGDGKRASILQPFPDQIRVLRDEIFSVAGPLSPMAEGDPVGQMLADGARVRVVNGTTTQGLSQEIADYLISQGMRSVILGGDAERRYDHTMIVVYGPKLYTVKFLVSVFEIDYPGQIVFGLDPDSSVDIEVRLGTDAISLLQ